jgi:hypothetical protein
MRVIDMLICFFIGHEWDKWIRGDTLTQRCRRCGKFEMKAFRRRK